MTLTRRLDAAAQAVFGPAAKQHFAAALARPRRITDICLFSQPQPPGGQAGPFTIAMRIPLLG